MVTAPLSLREADRPQHSSGTVRAIPSPDQQGVQEGPACGSTRGTSRKAVGVTALFLMEEKQPDCSWQLVYSLSGTGLGGGVWTRGQQRGSWALDAAGAAG